MVSLPRHEVPDPPLPASRKTKARAKTVTEWEAQRERIRKLYEVDGLALTTVIKKMEMEHGFQAT